MTRKEICNAIVEEVQERIGEGFEVNIVEMKKNNGVVYTGVCIKSKGDAIAPNIYIDGQIDMISEGDSTISEVVEVILANYEEIKDNNEAVKVTARGLNKEKVLETVICYVVNREKNEENVKEMPHKEFLDLAKFTDAFSHQMKMEHNL